MSEYIPYSSFWVWVISLSKVFSISIHLLGKFKMSMFFTAEEKLDIKTIIITLKNGALI